MNSFRFRAQRPFSKWRVRPFPGEGAFSYFHRLVKDQDDCTPTSYANALGLPRSKIGADELLQALWKLPIKDEQKQSLAKWTPLPVGGHFTVNGIPLHHRIIPLCRHRYCRNCIAEAPFHRTWWDIVGFEICPFHRVPLISWRSTTVGEVWPPFYGHEAERPVHEQSDRDNDHESFEAYLLRRLGFLAADGRSMSLLDDNSLDDVIWYAGTFGRFLRNRRTRRRPATDQRDFQVGFEALRNDRHHVVNSLKTWLIENNSQEDLRKGSVHALGWSSAFAQTKGRTGELTSPLGREIILAQTLACSKVGSVGFSRLGRSEMKVWPISLKRAGAMLGVTKRSVEIISESTGVTFDANAKHKLVGEAEFYAMRRFTQQMVDSGDAARKLKCSEAQLDRLAWNGFIRRIRFTRSAHPSYLNDDIGRILARIEKLPESASDAVTVDEAARRRNTSESAIMVAFLKGKFAGFREPGSSAFGALRLPASIKSAPKKRRGRPTRPGRKHSTDALMTRSEFKVMANLVPSSVAALVRHGHLSVTDEDMRDPLLLREPAMSFHERYVNPSPYLNVAVSRLRRRLDELDVPVLFGDICDNLIVERSRFEAATGLVTLPTDPLILGLWRDLRVSFERYAPSFMVPRRLGAMKQVVWTTAIKASFTVFVRDEGFHIEKKFGPRHSRRDWSAYAENPDRIRTMLAGFRWSQDTEGYTASMMTSSQDGFDRAAIGMGDLCDLLRVKQPPIRRKKRD